MQVIKNSTQIILLPRNEVLVSASLFSNCLDSVLCLLHSLASLWLHNSKYILLLPKEK